MDNLKIYFERKLQAVDQMFKIPPRNLFLVYFMVTPNLMKSLLNNFKYIRLFEQGYKI